MPTTLLTHLFFEQGCLLGPDVRLIAKLVILLNLDAVRVRGALSVGVRLPEEIAKKTLTKLSYRKLEALNSKGPLLALSLSILTLVVLGAIENLGISTAMPIVERQFGHVELYGWVFAAYSLSSLFGGAFFAVVGDRYSLRRGLQLAVGVFALGLLLGGVSISMATLVGARVVQGFGFGGFAVLPYTMISRYFEAHQKGKMLAAMASAWIVPSLFIPPIAGMISQSIGWRYVFIGVVPIAAIAGLFADSAVRKIDRDNRSQGQRPALSEVLSRSLAGLGTAISIGLIIVSMSMHGKTAGRFTLVFGVVLFVFSVVRLLLKANFYRRVDSVLILLARGLSSFAFFGIESFLPFVLFSVKKMPLTEAGLVLTASSFSWSAGSWFQARSKVLRSFKVKVSLGVSVFIFSLGMLWIDLSVTYAPGWVSVVAWFVAGAGLGVVYPSVTLAGLASVKQGSDSQMSSLLQIFDTGGFAVATGVIGALLSKGAVTAHLDLRVVRYASNFEEAILVAAFVATGAVLSVLAGRFRFLGASS